MKRNPARTPRSQIVAALRQLWLRSRERATAIKRDGYTCQHCNRKQSRAKGREIFVEVHHLDGCNLKELAEHVRRCLLHEPERLQTLCKECHGEAKEHGTD